MAKTARCACQQASITVDGEPITSMICHCDYCQRRTGSVFQVAAWFPDAQITAKAGEVRTWDTPIGVHYNFCPTCGTTLFWTFDFFPAVHAIAAGCFDGVDFPKPAMEIQTQYRHAWVSELAGIPQHTGFPPREG